MNRADNDDFAALAADAEADALADLEDALDAPPADRPTVDPLKLRRAHADAQALCRELAKAAEAGQA